MRNFKTSQLNLLLIILLVVSTLISVLCGITFYKGGAKLSMPQVDSQDDSWILVDELNGNRAIDLPCDVDAAKNSVVTITRRVPTDIDNNYVLFFKSNYQAVEVKINGDIVYSYGVDEKKPFGKSPVSVYNMVSIDKGYEGGNIEVSFMSGYKSYSGNIDSMYFGNRGDVLFDFVKKNAATFMAAVALVFMNIILVVVILVMGKYTKENMSMVYLLIFSLLSTAFCLCDNQLIQLFFSNMYFMSILSAMLLMIIPIAYLMYIRCFQDKKKVIRYIDYGIILYFISFVSASVFQFLGLIDYVMYLSFAKILLVAGLTILTVILALAITIYGKKSLLDNVIANVVVLVFLLASFVVSLVPAVKQYSSLILLLGVFVYVVSLVIVTERHILRIVEKKKKLTTKEIGNQKELALNQINPNFIFGAMNLVLGYIKTDNKDSAVALFDLSKYMRYNFNSLLHKEEVVSFSEELEHVKSYLDIQRRRYKDLSISYEIKVTDFKVPAFTIEPLVENAVKHGLGSRKYKGSVAVKSYERNDGYAISIIDNGVGFDIESVKSNSEKGITNVTRKLEELCQAEVNIVSKTGKGTVITIVFPK